MEGSVFVLVTVVCLVFATEETCNDLEVSCYTSLGCGNALHNYQLVCGRQLSGDTDECTEECQRALITLIARDNGYKFITCKCKRGNERYSDCDEKKRNIQVCKNILDAVERLNDTTRPINCVTAHLICDTDSTCAAALSYYNSLCGNLQDAGWCSERCNESINILYQTKYAMKLQKCKCDEITDNFNCFELRQNTDYCLKDSSKYSPVLVKNQSPGTYSTDRFKNQPGTYSTDLVNNQADRYATHDNSNGNRQIGKRELAAIVVVLIFLLKTLCQNM